MTYLASLALALAVALCAGALLAALAARIGWTDRVEAAPDRKVPGARVPLVGGAAVLLGAVAGSLVGARALGDEPWPALAAAFLLGLVDDLAPRGLSAATKLAGQGFVAALFALVPGAGWDPTTIAESAGLAALALVAMNAINLYDHADGLVGGLGALATLATRPAWAGAFLGYLPLNTVLRRSADLDGSRARTLPRAMLGDSGAHLAGIAIVASPVSLWFLALPVLDMLRVAALRAARRRPIWHGDRTHLGHRLAALGAGPVWVAAITWILVVPLLVVRLLTGGHWTSLVGLLAAVGGYAVVIAITAEVARTAAQGPGARPSEGPDASALGEPAAGPWSGAAPEQRPNAGPEPRYDLFGRELPGPTDGEQGASGGPFASV